MLPWSLKRPCRGPSFKGVMGKWPGCYTWGYLSSCPPGGALGSLLPLPTSGPTGAQLNSRALSRVLLRPPSLPQFAVSRHTYVLLFLYLKIMNRKERKINRPCIGTWDTCAGWHGQAPCFCLTLPHPSHTPSPYPLAPPLLTSPHS